VTVTGGAGGTTSWTVTWTLASGQTISQLWNGTLTTAGSAVTVKSLSYNGTLAPNATTTFGYIATGNPPTGSANCSTP